MIGALVQIYHLAILPGEGDIYLYVVDDPPSFEGRRVPFPSGSFSLVIGVENFWGERWYRLVLPDAGLGWVRDFCIRDVK